MVTESEVCGREEVEATYVRAQEGARRGLCGVGAQLMKRVHLPEIRRISLFRPSPHHLSPIPLLHDSGEYIRTKYVDLCMCTLLDLGYNASARCIELWAARAKYGSRS